MRITGLSLQHFRNYSNKTVLFTKSLTTILAPNASGKTNLLEAIHLLSTGESFRAGTVDDFIGVGQDLARIKMKAVKSTPTDEEEVVETELLLNHGLVSGKRVSKKIFSINGVKKQKRFVVGLVPTVAFIPEDLRLITGSPSRRREFLDTLLTQLDRNYLTALSTYDQTLRRRNRLLQQIRDGEAPHTTLSYWNLSLLKHGMYVQKRRREIVDEINMIQFPLHFQIEYDLSLLNEARLAQYSREEVASGHTLVGPHKDDIIVKFHVPGSSSAQPEFPLFTHGSRGQQRMGVLWLKLGAFDLLKKTTGHPPILLLDDIFSELDQENRLRVLELANSTQTIMTSAEHDILNMPELKHSDIISP
jgi:DNA replication and repair protein RecF